MKKTVCMVTIILLTMMYAVCESLAIDDYVFISAKEATRLIAAGKYSEASALLVNVSGAELCNKVEQKLNHTIKTNNQSDVSVGWTTANETFIAVPFAIPHDNMVKTVVYRVTDDSCLVFFDIYNWREVEIMYKQSSNVVWNSEYNPGYIVVID